MCILMHNTCLYCTQIALGSHPQPYIRRLQSLAPHSTAHRGTESRVVDLATEYRGVISPVDILHFSLGLYSAEYQRTTLRSFNGSSPQMSVEEDDLQQFHGSSPPLSMQCAAVRLLGRQLRHEEQSHVVGGCSAPPLLRCPRRPHRPRTVSAGRPRFSFRHTSKNHPKKLLSDVFSRNFQDAHVLCQFLNVWQHPQAAGPPWSAKSQSCRSAPPTRQPSAPSSIFTLKMHHK